MITINWKSISDFISSSSIISLKEEWKNIVINIDGDISWDLIIKEEWNIINSSIKIECNNVWWNVSTVNWDVKCWDINSYVSTVNWDVRADNIWWNVSTVNGDIN